LGVSAPPGDMLLLICVLVHACPQEPAAPPHTAREERRIRALVDAFQGAGSSSSGAGGGGGGGGGGDGGMGEGVGWVGEEYEEEQVGVTAVLLQLISIN
jgi:hypothetical protein